MAMVVGAATTAVGCQVRQPSGRGVRMRTRKGGEKEGRGLGFIGLREAVGTAGASLGPVEAVEWP